MGGDNNSVKDRISYIIETGGDNERDSIMAVAALTETGEYPNRRLLAAALEQRKIMARKRIITGLAAIRQKIEEAHKNAVLADKAATTMGNTLRDSEQRGRHLVAQSNSLAADTTKTDLKFKLATAFVNHFKLTPAESSSLHGLAKDAPLHEDFFDALHKVDKLHSDCRKLAHCGMDTAALDLMDSIGLHREAAAERLYRWSQRAARSYKMGNPSLLPTAMAHLRKRPVLFKSVLDEYSTARKTELARSFITALTEGSEGHGPIELMADKPLQYAGEVLRWIRKAPSSEKAALSYLMVQCDPSASEEEITALADITEGLRHPLEVRIDLILSSDHEAKLLRSLAELLREEGSALEKEIPGGALPAAVIDLKNKAEEAFIVAVKKRVETELVRGVRAPPSDLSPSATVTELSGFLREILSVVRGDSGEDMSKIVSLVTDPLLRAVDETACHLPTPDMAVYLLNCLYQLECTVALCRSAGGQLERIRAQADAQVDTLTSEQASHLVAQLNLGPIYPVLQEKNEQPLSTIPGVDPSSLKLFNLKFNSFLANPDVISLPQICLLMSSAIKTNVRRRSFDVIIAIYCKLYNAIKDPNNGYDNSNPILQRTPEDVKIMLSK